MNRSENHARSAVAQVDENVLESRQCERCARSWASNARYCRSCGGHTATPVRKLRARTCPRCGRHHWVGNWCGGCGAVLVRLGSERTPLTRSSVRCLRRILLASLSALIPLLSFAVLAG